MKGHTRRLNFLDLSTRANFAAPSLLWMKSMRELGTSAARASGIKRRMNGVHQLLAKSRIGSSTFVVKGSTIGFVGERLGRC